jgi:hypothetical protein
MILKPNNPETFSLALALENGIAQGIESESLAMANYTLNTYIDSILIDLSNKDGESKQVQVQPVSVIHSLSNTQFWVLCYIAVQQILTTLQGNLNYTLMSAFATFKEENPNINIDSEIYTTVDITNIVFETEFDLAIAYVGLEHILSVVAHQQTLQNQSQKEGE